jgi:hypothetical protein
MKQASSVETYVDLGIGIKYNYTGNSSSDKISISLTNDDLKRIYDGTMVIDGVKSTQLNINELYLDVCVAITNAQLPTTIDKGVVLQKMENASDAVNINYVCDDKIINFPALKNMKAELLEEAIDGIDLSDTQT